MANFYITAVRMDASNTHIDYVQIVQHGKAYSSRTINSRQFVAELIYSGLATFQTAIFNSGDWQYGATVHVVDGVFLSTDRNSTKRDNLGNLPRF